MGGASLWRGQDSEAGGIGAPPFGRGVRPGPALRRPTVGGATDRVDGGGGHAFLHHASFPSALRCPGECRRGNALPPQSFRPRLRPPGALRRFPERLHQRTDARGLDAGSPARRGAASYGGGGPHRPRGGLEGLRSLVLPHRSHGRRCPVPGPPSFGSFRRHRLPYRPRVRLAHAVVLRPAQRRDLLAARRGPDRVRLDHRGHAAGHARMGAVLLHGSRPGRRRRVGGPAPGWPGALARRIGGPALRSLRPLLATLVCPLRAADPPSSSDSDLGRNRGTRLPVEATLPRSGGLRPHHPRVAFEPLIRPGSRLQSGTGAVSRRRSSAAGHRLALGLRCP